MTRIHIRYCTQCQWLLRSAWYAQELLSTFGEQLTEVALSPSHGGTFEIWQASSGISSHIRLSSSPVSHSYNCVCETSG